LIREWIPVFGKDHAPTKHDPEKWIPVFGKDHAPTKHDPEKWIPVFGKDHAPTKCNGARDESPLCFSHQWEWDMLMLETPTTTQLTQVISQVTAPAFLLGAVASFISVLLSRMNRIIDRSQALNAIADDDKVKSALKSDLPRLKARAALLNRAILYSTIAAIVTAILVIVAFVSAYLAIPHEYGVAVLFILALALFTASLVNLARETRIALHEYDHFGSS
jgi:hypothetical protein